MAFEMMDCFLEYIFLNLILEFSCNSGGGVGLGEFFHIDWCGKCAKLLSGGRVCEVLEDRRHLLLTTHVCGRNYLI